MSQVVRFYKNRIFLTATIALSTFTSVWLGQKFVFRNSAMSLAPPSKKALNQAELNPENIVALLAESNIIPSSNATSAVAEPSLPPGISLPPDIDAMGYQTSKFLIDTKWATIRFVGDNPAGAGLSGAELNKAQIEALGSFRDTIPVVTTAQTINDMMEQYFSPLILGLPRGEDILSRIKVQGVYYSPRYVPADGTQLDRDNAFVVGVQSMYIYPNSCFDKTAAPSCSPIGYSAGHDPTIIGHELSHVIFNHIRDERSLEGWQWFAVNEGYADFFSACYFGDPSIGRIWRVSRPSGNRYLRRLLDTPTTNDPKALEEGHAFGTVWSSALWRSRSAIVNQFRIKPIEFERVVLMSINFLGESTKPKLGDAAAAVLKAADVLDHSNWKNILIQEFKKSEVDLSRGQKLAAASNETIVSQQSGVSCGNLPQQNLQSERSKSQSLLLASLLILLPTFVSALRLRKYRFIMNHLNVFARNSKQQERANNAKQNFLKIFLVSLSGLHVQGCQLVSFWKGPQSKPDGLAIVYDCNLSNLRDGTPALPSQRAVSLTFLDSAPADPKNEQIFVGDERFEKAESTLLMLVDKTSMRIDQVRKRDGSLFQIDLNQKFVHSEDAIAVQNLRLGTIIIEGVGRALLGQKDQAGKALGSASAIDFDITGSPASATVSNDIVGARGFGPLANEITLNGAVLCRFKNSTR